MDSEKTIAQKEVVKTKTEHMHKLENDRTFLTKFVMDEKNADNPLMDRASSILARLKGHLRGLKEELAVADAAWLACQLDDLDEELNKPSEA